MTRSPNPVYVAIDTPDVDAAVRVTTGLQDSVGGIKLGLEFFCRNGHGGVKAVQAANNLPLFLDLKFHDIPNTVAGAVRSVMPLAPAILNVHASGGLKMMIAARQAAEDEAARLGISPPHLLAVTVLTSLSDGDLVDGGISSSTTDQVRRLAALTHQAGLAGVVCSPWETKILRADLGPDFLLVTPGVRPLGAAQDDQKRIMTPGEAMAAGASLLVIGRPITAAPDPFQAARQISHDLEHDLEGATG